MIDAGQLKKEKPLAPIEETEIPFELPRNWKWCRLGQLVGKVEYGTSEKAILNGEVPILRMNNIQEGKISLANLKYVKSSIKDLPRLYVKNGDIIFNRTNSYELVGKCGVFKERDDTYTLASYLIRIAVNPNHISSEYLASYINSKLCRDTQIQPEITQQTGQANFSGSKLKSILVPVPPVQEQQRIVTKVHQLMRLCDEMEEQVIQGKTEAEQLLHTILREAFEGKQTVPKQATKQDEVFWQKQLLANYINMLMEQHQEQGEMAIAKYTYLNDRVNNAGSGFRYVPHNFGPYSPEIKDCLTAPDAPFCKKTVGKKGYEVYHVNKELEAGFIDPENGALQEAQKGFWQLMQVFSVFPMQERARQLELVASICWLMEQKRSTDIDVLYEGLQNWSTPKRDVKHKGQLFTKEETLVGLELILKHGWQEKLLS